MEIVNDYTGKKGVSEVVQAVLLLVGVSVSSPILSQQPLCLNSCRQFYHSIKKKKKTVIKNTKKELVARLSYSCGLS
jgi:hypothetical protein